MAMEEGFPNVLANGTADAISIEGLEMIGEGGGKVELLVDSPPVSSSLNSAPK